MGKLAMYVLRCPASAYGPAEYYPPGAAVCAQWARRDVAEGFRLTLDNADVWSAMTWREARALDKRAAEAWSQAEIRRVLAEEQGLHWDREIDETPGDLMSYPMLDGGIRDGRALGNLVQVPVVAIRRIEDGPAAGTVVKMPDGAIAHLPPDWALDDEPAEAWREHLAKWRAGGYSYVREKSKS